MITPADESAATRRAGARRARARSAWEASQDKAVLNNARQLAAAADQFYLENDVSSVSQSGLIGSTNYVKALNLVANETYPGGFTQGVTITIDGVAGARTITYAP